MDRFEQERVLDRVNGSREVEKIKDGLKTLGFGNGLRYQFEED